MLDSATVEPESSKSEQKLKGGVLEIAASKGDDCSPTKTACSGSRTNASEL